MMNQDDSKRIAHETAMEVVDLVFDRLGVDLNNPKSVEEFRQDMQFARKQRKGAEEMAGWIKRTAIGAFVLGALWTFLWGLQRVFGGT